jgi:excisionase family DNA binding protein
MQTLMTAPIPTRPAGQPWTLREASDFLQVSARTLTRMAEAGKLKVLRVGVARGRVLIPDAEMRRLISGE